VSGVWFREGGRRKVSHRGNGEHREEGYWFLDSWELTEIRECTGYLLTEAQRCTEFHRDYLHKQ